MTLLSPPAMLIMINMTEVHAQDIHRWHDICYRYDSYIMVYRLSIDNSSFSTGDVDNANWNRGLCAGYTDYAD